MNPVHSIQIGTLKLSGNVFLAPMAGYTDKIYRSICLEHGADLAYTEMVSSEGVARDSKKTVMLMERGKNETNLAVQLFMPDEDTARRSIAGVMKYNPQLIDINMGCPVPKVTKTGAGSSLLKTPDTIYRIVKALTEETGVPVSVKIRKGWDCDSINYLTTAQAAFDGGASALCMHARTRSQLYMPFADWDSLKTLKEKYPDKIIIGSGDLFTAQDAIKMFEQTKVDAVAFARGAIGNPFVFEQTKALAQSLEVPEFSTEEKVREIKRHLYGLSEFIGEKPACREMRKHVCAYLKGIPNSSRVKNAISQAETIDDYLCALSLLFN